MRPERGGDCRIEGADLVICVDVAKVRGPRRVRFPKNIRGNADCAGGAQPVNLAGERQDAGLHPLAWQQSGLDGTCCGCGSAAGAIRDKTPSGAGTACRCRACLAWGGCPVRVKAPELLGIERECQAHPGGNPHSGRPDGFDCRFPG
jgi:hypothetical protein